jgi:hypothetical protein
MTQRFIRGKSVDTVISSSAELRHHLLHISSLEEDMEALQDELRRMQKDRLVHIEIALKLAKSLGPIEYSEIVKRFR